MSDFEQDRALDVLLDDALCEAEEDAPNSRPAFADIVARAHEINRRAVPVEAVERAARAGGATDIVGEGRCGGAGGFSDFVEAARAEAAADIVQRRALGAPPRRRQGGGKTRRLTVAVATVVSAAAAVLLALSFGFDEEVSRVDDTVPRTQAAAELGRQGSESFRAVERAPVRAPRRATPTRRGTPIIPDDPAPLQPAPETVVEEAPSESTPPRPVAQRLKSLDARAEQMLAAGDADGADRLYQRIIAEGGRRTRVELAYAERFTIAHRQRKSSKQRKLYQAYLRAFPRGRFVDDARAGLCRTLSQDRAEDCWSDYLRELPRGAYAAEAKRANARAQEPR